LYRQALLLSATDEECHDGQSIKGRLERVCGAKKSGQRSGVFCY